MDINERIGRFEQLCREDAGNDMAHFSLAGAYAQAERWDDAAAAYLRAIERNEGLSKAYQLAGAAYIKAARRDDAADILRRGYVVAATRGDLMPRNAMGELLKQIGVAIPEVAASGPAATPAGDGSFIDLKSGRPGTKMPRPPFRGGVGAWIHEHISKQTFDEWIGLGTKIVNELKLDLSRDEHEVVYDYAMRRFLRLDDATYQSVTGGKHPPEPGGEYRHVIDSILGTSGDLEQHQGKLDRRIGH